MFSEQQILDWVQSRISLNQYAVHITPLSELEGWKFDSKTGDLEHVSGKFFRFEGLDVQIKTNVVQCWQQPILNQPEIGVLGFLSKRINGILHFLVQAKMEPGNINFIQISPTVQATKSNYTQVHGGKRPAFIEYFLDQKVGRILVDQLQSEQGTRYLKKRNRNMVVQLPDDYPLEHSEDYIWVTVGQLQKLMRYSNLIHLDCRSIIGCFSYNIDPNYLNSHIDLPQTTFNSRVCSSIFFDDSYSEQNMKSVLSWLTNLKSQIEVNTLYIPLNRVAEWELLDEAIRHKTNKYFSVIGVDVVASNREVSGWSQPLIKSVEGGIIGIATQIRNGILHFLVQGRVEPGLIDIIELGPTVQCTPINYQNCKEGVLPAFVNLFQCADQEQIHFDAMLSDEGGRFFHSQQRHLIIELATDVNVELPSQYCWMTLRQIQSFAQFNNYINIELRSILSCLALGATH